jgi:exodeoxyribonuclease V alpha subunit
MASGISTKEVRSGDGYQFAETVVTPTELRMLRHRGQIIVEYLTKSPRFRGIGNRKARELWSRFGDDLYRVLDDGNREALQEVLTPEAASALAEAWKTHVAGRFVSFLQSQRFPARLAGKVLEFYGQDAERKLADDPYRLLAFSGSWSSVNALAQRVYDVAPGDPRRLRAAIEETLYQLLHAKHTAAEPDAIKTKLQSLLAVGGNADGARLLAAEALASGLTNGAYIRTDEGRYQAIGPYIMEREIAERIGTLLREPDPQPSLLLARASTDQIAARITEYEYAERERRCDPSFALNAEQRRAVHICVAHRFSLITGGAGTGKTAVLKCLYHVLHALGYAVVQMALAGKAAKRMREATQREAHTIAGFVRRSSDIVEQHGAHTYFVIDESSMLDLPTSYRIFRALPETVRIVMVGDPYQLPPIGPGLIFQALVGRTGVPQTMLTEVKRQEGATGIPFFAAAVRGQRWPNIRVPGVRLIECADADILGTVLELFAESPHTSQILCATKNCSRSGVRAANRACQAELNANGRPIRVHSNNGRLCDTAIRERDRILFVRNDWDRGVMNGSIGHLLKAFATPEEADGEDDIAVGVAKVDGEEVPVYLSDLDAEEPRIDLGYAITVHKAQGSQFPRVIIPVTCAGGRNLMRSRILDMTWVYTAITRAEQEVILVGDPETAKTAVTLGSRWQERTVGFLDLLTSAR